MYELVTENEIQTNENPKKTDYFALINIAFTLYFCIIISVFFFNLKYEGSNRLIHSEMLVTIKFKCFKKKSLKIKILTHKCPIFAL